VALGMMRDCNMFFACRGKEELIQASTNSIGL